MGFGGNPFKKAWNKASDAAKKSAAAVATGAEIVSKHATNAAKKAKKMAFDTAKWIKKTAQKIGEKATRAGKWAAEKVSQGVQEAKDIIKDAFKKAKEITSSVVIGAIQVTCNIASTMKNTALDTYAKVTTFSEKSVNADVFEKAITGQNDPNNFGKNEVNGLNLDTLGAVTDKPIDHLGYEKTDYGYIQIDPTEPGPDYYLLIKDPEKMTDKQKHYFRNVEYAELIRKGKIPTDLDEFLKYEVSHYNLLPEGKSSYHMGGENGGYNIKLVNNHEYKGYDIGQLEVVYSTVTGKLDLSPENMPTLNDAGPHIWDEHFSKDMIPYYSSGNTPHDKGTAMGRLSPGKNKIGDQNDPVKMDNYLKIRERIEGPKNGGGGW